MDPQELRDKIMAAINGLIKTDEPGAEDQAKADLHDVLAAKMRDRINPPEDPATVDLDDPTDPTDPAIQEPPGE